MSGPLTQLRNSDAVSCTDAHTAVDKHISMFVYMCVYRGSVNPLLCSPSFETDERAQRLNDYLRPRRDICSMK